MADCEQFITGCFPSIDQEIVHYVNGMLEDGVEEFGTSEDLFEAIGPLLQQVDDTKTDDDIREICDRLYNLVTKGEPGSSSSDVPHKILDAPIHMGALTQEDDVHQMKQGSIWIAKRDDTLQVNQKQLAKAEAMIQKKLDKRALQDNTAPKKTNGLDGPTASQQFNRKDVKFDASGSNRSYDVKIDNFDIAFGERVLITGASIHLVAGRRYGLCGRNGLGKTTLLKMISSGDLKIPSHISILHVEQEVVGDETEAVDSVLECDFERHELLQKEKALTQMLNLSPGKGDNNMSSDLSEIYRRLEAIEADKAPRQGCSDPSWSRVYNTNDMIIYIFSPGKGDNNMSSDLSEIYRRLEAIEADKAPAKAAVILAGLGFTTQMQKQKTKALSGGWRMRLALARALFSKPDLLLLDEPTNMLDMKAIIWLENYLQTWATTILVVSHDRSFLNSVCTDIIHLHNKMLDVYKGNYENFHRTREERLKNQQKEYDAQKQYRDHIQVFIDRFRYNANRASQVQSKLKLLEKLPELKPVEKDTEVIMKFPECDKLTSSVLQMDELQFYYSKDRIIFNNVDCNANMQSRICIVGENGAGKTTLLKILLGELSPTKGVRHAHRNLRIGYFSQHHVDQLDMSLTSVEMLAEKFPGKTSEYYRGQLGSYGVSGELATRPVSSLSGGQKSRVAFAVMSMTNPNFFILDEPTNHLDMETIEALGIALNKFEGGVILVSHDERLIQLVCKELWVVKDGKIHSLEGGFLEYRKIVEEELAAQGC